MIKKEDILEYHNNKNYINRSRLFRFSKSPEHFKYLEEHETEKTRALVFGNAFHTYVLEPEEFDKRYFVKKQIDGRTAEGRAYLQELATETRDMITFEEFQQIVGMADSINNNELAKALLTKGQIETSIYFEDEITKEKVKVRPDIYRILKNKIIITDLKSCVDASTENFKREMIKYGYDLQAYMLQHALNLEYNLPTEFIFVAVEKTPPYAVNVMLVDNYIYVRGERLFREFLGIYADCKKTNNWYGYLGFSNQINELTLPNYLLAEIDEVDANEVENND